MKFPIIYYRLDGKRKRGAVSLGSRKWLHFCAIIHSKAPADIIHRTPLNVVFLSKDPDRHPLIVPIMHTTDWSDPKLTREVLAETIFLERSLINLVRDAYRVSSVAVLSTNGPDAGQVIWHAHRHIIPCLPSKRTIGVKPYPLEDFPNPTNVLTLLRSGALELNQISEII